MHAYRANHEVHSLPECGPTITVERFCFKVQKAAVLLNCFFVILSQELKLKQLTGQ
jgi:hypothetical protein